MLKIMILDDEALPRIALRNIASRRYEVVGEAATGESGVEIYCKPEDAPKALRGEEGIDV